MRQLFVSPKLAATLAVIAFLVSAVITTTPWTEAQAPDYDLPVAFGAHFFTQTNGGAGNTGYAVSNADGIPFWNFFQSAGGVEAVGYPVSHRFIWNGFTVQAMQKVVFQWRPEVQTVYYVNVLDEMHNAGLDGYLQTVRVTPPIADWSGDAGLSWDRVMERHLALLSANQAIAEVYYSEEDPINRNGLPMAPIQDMGGVFVLRAQRKVYQQWLTDQPWARAGQVVVANGGDLGKEANLYPAAAVTPQPPSSVPLSVVSGAPAPTATPTATPQPGACQGDETIRFNPANPVVGQAVNISVTSARPSANIVLSGPYNPSYLGSRTVDSLTEWNWLVTPTEPGRADYTFMVSGVVCTANFVVVGGGAEPTQTPTPTSTATETPTPTATP